MGQASNLKETSRDTSQQTDEGRIARRSLIAKEIVDTEATYVASLVTLSSTWETPLRDALVQGEPIIGEKDIDAIFSISSSILEVHNHMLKTFQQRIEKWHDEQELADIFLTNAKALVLYTEYVNNYDNALLTLRQILKWKPFEKFAESITGEELNVTTVLPSLLIQPIQRIPRYKMLLEDLLKSTWTSHPDYEALQASTEQISHVAMYINQQKKKHDSLQKLLVIQNDLGKKYELLSVNRLVLDECYCKLLHVKKEKEKDKAREKEKDKEKQRSPEKKGKEKEKSPEKKVQDKEKSSLEKKNLPS